MMLLLQHFKYKLQLDIQRLNNLSINFYLVLHKMWYFFSTELKMPKKKIFYPKSMNFISAQKFLLRTVSTPVVYIKLGVM